jgi:hypothetical protein
MAAIFIIITSLAGLGSALVGNDWSIEDVPDAGLQDITFPFNMAKAPHVTGYYFAQQYSFVNVDQIGYTGLQPREDKDGQSIVHGVFSSFQGGTTSDHPNCSEGADGGPGVSCAVEIVGDYSHTYHCVVENIGDTTWRGSLVDTVTGESVVIGLWSLPAGAGGIQASQGGFVEYYPWNDGKEHGCETLPWTEATFGSPFSSTKSAGNGSITSVYEYGGCEGKAGFSKEETSDGWDIKVGFSKSSPCKAKRH